MVQFIYVLLENGLGGGGGGGGYSAHLGVDIPFQSHLNAFAVLYCSLHAVIFSYVASKLLQLVT